MKEEESLKEVADRYGTRPIEILKIMLVESGELLLQILQTWVFILQKLQR